MEYLPRAVDSALDDALDGLGAVLIEGPRGCGKTSTGLHHAASSIRLDADPSLVQLAHLNPAGLLAGDVPRLVDEWQLADTLWNAVRHEIDERQQPGQFILSGSATPDDDVTRHSGAGRFARLRMRTMSLAESGRSSLEIPLSSLGEASVSGATEVTYRDLADCAVIGGWPALASASASRGVTFNRSYLDDVCGTAISDDGRPHHDPGRLRRLLGAVARNVSQEATLRTLRTDVIADGGEATEKTIRTYLDSLARVFAVDELPAWSVSLRSKSRLRTASKLHLADPALACAALGVGADRLSRDPEYFGQVFESMVVRDLRSLASAEWGRVYHYRDNTGLEVDVIVEYPDGRWGACEVKLGSNHIPDAEANLLTLRDERVDTHAVGEPAFLAVITGTQYAYTLPSGVHVVPLATLSL